MDTLCSVTFYIKMTVNTIVVFILLYSFSILNAAGKNIEDFNCPCGIDRNHYLDDKSYKKDVKKETAGGQKLKYTMPWMAKLSIKKKSDSSLRRCGAVLINSKFLLTAAHCLCNKQIPLTCALLGRTWRPKYNLTEIITAYIPIKTISEKVRFKKTMLLTALIHKKFLKRMSGNAYKDGKDGPYDIAVIEMKYKIDFYRTVNNQINMVPICLPSKEFKDVGINAMVARHGYHHVRKEGECITDEKGPDIFTHCSRKHKKGKMSKNDYNDVCIEDKRPPSNLHKICKYFNFHENKDVSMEEAILIPWFKNHSALNGFPPVISCFSNKAKFGWCKTCNNKAVNNTPGFCDPNILNDTNDKNVPIATVDSGWGFCSKNCHIGFIKEDIISKQDVYILSENECQTIQKYYKGKKKEINTVLQLCAGVKLNFSPVYYYYEKISGEKRYKFSKIQEGKEPVNWKTKRLKDKHGYGLPFHIGAKDSCYSDKGDALWTMYDNKKILVGLVSSRVGCAEVNWPGVYCRIKYKLAWIYKYAKSGVCKKLKIIKKQKKKK